MWQPIQEQHAISQVACIFDFQENLPSKLYRKLVTEAEDLAFSNGLRSRHTTKTVPLQIDNPEDLAVQIIPPPPPGYIFNSLAGGGDETQARKRSEQLSVEASRLVYNTWVYASWEAMLDRLRALVFPLVEMAMEATPLRVLRLEYQDAFWYDGPQDEAAAADLLQKGSPYLSSHIFDQRDLWHCHTGAYLPHGRIGKLLLQINLDAVDRKYPGRDNDIARSVKIVTALERRAFMVDPEILESEQASSEDDVVSELNEMHGSLKEVLADIISQEMSERIHLKD